MKKLLHMWWGLRTGFSYCPIMYLCYIFIQFIRATLNVYITVMIGNIINQIYGMLDGNGEFDTILINLIVWAGLNVILWVTVEFRWRFSDDILPMRARVGSTKKLVSSSLHIPLRQYDKKDFCDAYDRYKDGIYSLEGFVKSVIGIFSQIYGFILSFVSLWNLNPFFSFLLLTLAVICYFSTRKIASIQNESRIESTEHNRLAGYISGMFFGTFNRETRLLGLKDYYISKWRKAKDTLYEIDLNATKKTSRMRSIPTFVSNAMCPMIVIGASVVFVSIKRMAIGGLYTAWELSKSTLGMTNDLVGGIISLYRSTLEIEETYLFDRNLKSYKDAGVETISNANYGEKAVEVDNVTFSYDDVRDVLNNISFSIEKGQIVALLGENGSGKSTLIKLILGLYEPKQGEVKVFGNATYNNLDYVTQHVGACFQDFCTYPFTLRENIAFGSISDISDDKALIEALKKADGTNILEKAGALERIIGRHIDDSGIELSGGEWQRLALSRAYLGEHDILIFDEPSAKLDPLSELRQFETIREVAKNKAVILVSHRIGFARLADRIIFLKDGELVESGTHDELYSYKGNYYRLFNAQKELYTVGE